MLRNRRDGTVSGGNKRPEHSGNRLGGYGVSNQSPTRSLSSVTKSIRSGSRSLLVILAALALFATACGGGRSAGEADAAIAASEAAEAALVLSADLATSQLLNTSDGSATSLSEVITGDRAVLLWYWAPH